MLVTLFITTKFRKIITLSCLFLYFILSRSILRTYENVKLNRSVVLNYINFVIEINNDHIQRILIFVLKIIRFHKITIVRAQ